MATTSKHSPISELLLTRWLNDCEKARAQQGPLPPPKAATARALPVRFMFGINGRNAIVPILHRSEELRRNAGVPEQWESLRAPNSGDDHEQH
jgi:hypothetical protein